MMLEDFLEHSRPAIQAIVGELRRFDQEGNRNTGLPELIRNQGGDAFSNGEHFFLRSSVEYANPQLTLEEVQGIIASRLVEVCGTYFYFHGLHEMVNEDVTRLCETLEEPPRGKIVPFLLNTDDVEPDRYSINPMKESIVESGQSAFPSAFVKTDGLKIDEKFVKKYESSLISKYEVELVERHLTDCSCYVDMVDAVKREQLKMLSDSFGIDLCLPIIRMPLEVLKKESSGDLLHTIVRETHKDYEAVERVYNCMGRSMKNRTTLLTVPHSMKGFGSKRAARGRIYFNGKDLESIKVTYRTTPLYPNAMDPKDVSIAKAEDQFTIKGERLADYSFKETPSSPQFILYSLESPEDAALWHGIGESGAPQLVKSYISARLACAGEGMVSGLRKYGIVPKIPLQLNLVPENKWYHPMHRNTDASIGSVKNLEDLARLGVQVECLPIQGYARPTRIC
jgi:hypothetical protein